MYRASLFVITATIALVTAVPASAKSIGGNVDPHGCYLTAGYQWCDAKQKCIRSWEESCTPGYKPYNYPNYGTCQYGSNSFQSCLPPPYQAWGNPMVQPIPTPVPRRVDTHGCVLSDEEKWCGSLSKCIKPWEERCLDAEAGPSDVDYSFVNVNGRNIMDCSSTADGKRVCRLRYGCYGY